MGFIFGGSRNTDSAAKEAKAEAEADANTSIKKQEEVVAEQEATEKRKGAARQRALRTGKSMRALVGGDREDPFLGNPLAEKRKLGPRANPKGMG